MPIMALFRSPSVDQTQYDALIQELDLEQRPPAGALTHACGFDEGGICVADVWESRADFDAFLTDRLRPAFTKLGIEFVEPQILDTYAFTASEGTDRYMRERGADFGAAREGGVTEDRPGAPH
ncbi:MAG TPA: hypothetical protein VJS38_11265 [Phenylobacterium sp.]|uniref:hypothetical protein n=1 Tax=Phenylobacterium sp. TaxID=1871053 RepID=UPI002B473332|nr:hypothetical protein [Phenylobacterium sp.]HKR88741.1 hypothetical protein [Phenylobacterium sp.]